MRVPKFAVRAVAKGMEENQQSICLCMIVKNEAAVIGRCLDSVRRLIGTWIIVDTGSTDGTQGRIREHLRDLPGQLYERPWVDFAHNRTEALQLARGQAEYLLIIDADEMLEFSEGFRLPPLTADAYQFKVRSGNTTYYKTQLVRDALNWSYRGVVHEHLFCDSASVMERLPHVQTLRLPDGARARDPLTYRKDALLLEEALLAESHNPRHMFYLAQSYADAGEPLLAIDRYSRRIAMGGWSEEVWYSQLQIAGLKQKLHALWPEVMEAYLAAFAVRPDRAEPLFLIGSHYQAEQQYAVAFLFFSHAITLPYPESDLLFVDKQMYDLLLPLEYSVACFYLGRHQEAIEVADRLLASSEVGSEWRDQILKNRECSIMELARAGHNIP